MALLSSLLATLWLILCCAPLVAGHDDTGVFVQRSVMQHGQEEPAVQEPVLCTKQEEEDFARELKVYTTALLGKQKDVMENFTNMSHGIIAAHAAPLFNISKDILATAVQVFRPVVTQILKFGMQRVAKPKKKYSKKMQVDLLETLVELKEAANNVSGVAKAIFFEGLRDIDESLNQTLAAAPPPIPDVPILGVPAQGREVKDYLLKKVLPTIIAETNPSLAKSVWLLTSGREVDKVIYSLMDAVQARMKEPVDVPAPQKRCFTCLERYWYQVDNVESGCILERCDSILMECTNGPTVSCLRRFGPCLKCHSELMEQLDQCSNTTMLSFASDKLSNISRVLSSQMEEHYNKFLARLSEAVVY